MNEALNCPNCGAPVEGSKCPYCGTIIFDLINFDCDEHTPTFVRLRIGGITHLFKAMPRTIDIHTDYDEEVYYCDNTPIRMMRPSPNTSLQIEMDILTDSDGVRMLTIDPKQYKGGW